jgi:hypothetical protein
LPPRVPSPAARAQPQEIASRYIDPSKFTRFLDDKFGPGKYRIVMQCDTFVVTARCQLRDVCVIPVITPSFADCTDFAIG